MTYMFAVCFNITQNKSYSWVITETSCSNLSSSGKELKKAAAEAGEGSTHYITEQQLFHDMYLESEEL